MHVKYLYDEKTQELIWEWEKHLEDYDELFFSSYTGGEHNYQSRLQSDHGWRSIKDVLTNIRRMAIPESIRIIK